MQRRCSYKNPPIEEALCELRFTPGQDWDFTIPGKLHTELGDEYDGKPQEQKALEVELKARGDEPADLRYSEGIARVHLVTKDGKRIVGIGPDALSVHMLRPYQDIPEQGGWSEFRQRIEKALDAYWKVAQPKGVNRVGIRFINKIIIPQNKGTIADYLKCALPVVNGLPDRLNGSASRVDYSYEDGIRLVLSYWSINESSNQVLFLDLDLIWENTEPIVRDEAMLKVDDLHTRERDAFETVITDEARRLFNDD